jgi:hypothetical protein
MSRGLSFERDDEATLSFVPLGVRRKLDLAGLKVSLPGWRALPLVDRLALRDLVVDDATGERAFAALLRESAAGAGVALLDLPPAAPAWRSASVPAPVAERVGDLSDERWRGLDDEARYVLLKLAERAREPERLAAAVRELVDPRAPR